MDAPSQQQPGQLYAKKNMHNNYTSTVDIVLYFFKMAFTKKKSSPTGFANGKSTIQILHVPVIFPKSHAISSETVWLWLLNCQRLVKQTTSWGLASWDPEHARFIVLGRKRSSWRSPGFFQHNWGFCWEFARNQRSTPRPTKYNPKMVKYRKSTELMGWVTPFLCVLGGSRYIRILSYIWALVRN